MLMQQLINGLSLGVTYSLVAVGYTLVFGVLNIINMAHGAIFMAAAYVFIFFLDYLKVPFYLAFAISIFSAGFFGILLERLTIRPIIKKGALLPLITTIGVSVILRNTVINLFTNLQRPFPIKIAPIFFELGPIKVSNIQLINLVVAFSLMIFLKLYIDKTKTGLAIRAVAENIDIAGSFGINTSRIMMLTVGLASFMGGIAGLLIGLTFDAITPWMGDTFGLKGLIILIVAGVSSIEGAMVVGIILGIVEILSVAYISPAFRDAIAFAFLFSVLVVRPSGLFGKE
ncbi:MAG: branched-chain amino acid ABC transporter permease [Thermodesulfobacteriota bacterium]